MNLLGDLFKPLVEASDELFTSDEERMKMIAAINGVEANVNLKVIELDIKKLEIQRDIEQIRAGMNQSDASGSWYQKLPRPMLMLVFGLIFAAHCVFKIYRLQALGGEEIAAVLAYLGIVSGGRSWEKVQAMKR